MDFNSLDMSLQPVVVLRRLTEEDINFYTQCSPKRRSYRKKKQGRKNLKDEQRVDFSFFEEYRRSRNSYLKNKERKKKKTVRKKKTKTLPAEVVPAPELLPRLPEEINNTILSNSDCNKVPVKKQRKKREPKDPSEKKKSRKPRMKFKRMVIESDSDCSVENYGIVYSGTGNGPAGQQHNCSGEGVGHNLPQGVFLQHAMQFHSNIQNSVSSSPNISPSCSDVMINEQDILSALDCEPEEDFYTSVISTKLCKSDQMPTDNSFLAFINDTNTKVIDEFQTHQKLSEMIPSAISGSLNVHEECSSDDIVKESCDVVSKIMQDMDREYANRKKILTNNKQKRDADGLQVKSDSVSLASSPVIINLQPARNVLPGGVTDSTSSIENRSEKLKQFEDVSFSIAKNVPATLDLTKSADVHPDVTLAVDAVVKAISLSCQQPLSFIKRNEQKCSKLVTFCKKCHLVFTPTAQWKDVCEKCSKLSCADSIPLKERLVRSKSGKQKRISSLIRFASPKKIPFLKSLSPLKHKKPTGFRSSFVKKLSIHDKSRLLCSNTSKRHHLKRKLDLNIDEVPGDETETASIQIERQSFPNISSSLSISIVPKSSVDDKSTKTDVSKLSIKKLKVDGVKDKVSSNSPVEKAIKNVNIGQSADKAEKCGFTMKSVDKGIMLMSFPETDKELDFSLDCPSDSAVNKNDLLSTVGLPNISKAADMNQDKETNTSAVQSLSEVEKKLSKVKDLAYKFVVPNTPVMFVAHYAKDQQGPDFHLSRVSYQEAGKQGSSLSVVPSVTSAATTPLCTATKTITKQNKTVQLEISPDITPGSGPGNLNTSYSMPMFPITQATDNRSTTANTDASQLNPVGGNQRLSNRDLTLLPNSMLTDSIQIKAINVPQSKGVAKSCETLPTVSSISTSTPTVFNAGNPIISEQKKSTLSKKISNNEASSGAPKSTDTSLVPYTASRSSSTEHSDTSDNPPDFSSTKSDFDKHKGKSKSTASLVLHELDAIAILSILDLDGNAQHANNLLYNLFMKELQELQKLKALYHDATEDDFKEIANMKCQAKMSRIKSLSIARALLKKYGELSKVIEAVLTKPVTENSLPYDSVSASVQEPNLSQDLALLRQPKLEKGLISNGSCMYQRKSTEEMDMQVDAAADSYQRSEPLSDTNNDNSPSSVTISIKPEKTKNSSCMLSGMLTSNANSSTGVTGNINATMLTGYASNAIKPTALSQLLVTPVSNPTTTAIVPVSNSLPATTNALVPMNFGGYFNSSPSFSQLSPVSTSSTVQYNNSPQGGNTLLSTMLTSQPNSAGVSLTPIASQSIQENIKGETTRSSCQMQNQPTVVNPYNNYMQAPQNQSINSMSCSPRTSVQQTQIVPYHQILSSVQVSKASDVCPNITVPFAPNRMSSSQMNVNRSLVPMNYMRNTVPSANNLMPNPLTVQQVVLSNVPQVSMPQNRFAVTPYNYIMPQQTSNNLQVVSQQTPSNLQVLSHQQPSNIQVISQQRPMNVQVVSRQTPSNLQMVSHRTPSNLQVVSHQTPSNLQVVSHQTPSNLQVVSQQTAMNVQVVPQQMSNVYAIYQQPSGSSQVVCRPTISKPVNVLSNNQNGSQVLPRLDLMNCVVCGKRATMRCKQCAQVVYCNTECAKIYWHQRHKVECKANPVLT